MPEDNAKDKSFLSLTRMRQNPWILTTIFLAVILVAYFFTNGSLTGSVVGKSTAAEKLVSFANSQGITLSINEVIDEGSFYQINFTYNGQESAAYITKDGDYLIQPMAPLTGDVSNSQSDRQESTTKVPKTDKPVVELFVMSYCPYGTQSEKGIIPAIEALGNKIDFKLRFVYYAMHDKQEIDENTRQYCIQKEQSAKLLPYLKCFLEEGDSASCLTEVGIDKNKLNSCVASTDSQFRITANYNDRSSWLSGNYPLFDIDKALNTKYEIGGSPTLVINGVQSNSGRDSASYLKGICVAFNNAPAECSQTLSTTSPSAGFGYSASESSGSSATCS